MRTREITSPEVKINGELAALTFFSKKDGLDYIILYRLRLLEEYGGFCLWLSIGRHKDNVRFLNGKGMKTDFIEGEFVVTQNRQ